MKEIDLNEAEDLMGMIQLMIAFLISVNVKLTETDASV